jgi:hypothetical protein
MVASFIVQHIATISPFSLIARAVLDEPVKGSFGIYSRLVSTVKSLQRTVALIDLDI